MVWRVIVNPRPLLTIRTEYDGHSQTPVVRARYPFRYREWLRQRVDTATLDDAVSRAVDLHRS